MANSLITNDGKKVMIHRYGTSNPSYTIPSVFKVGVNSSAISAGSSSLTNTIPIDNGTVIDDGSNNFTGSSGGDNSTNNTTTYKEGAGTSDATAQNLIANNTNATKIWTRTLTTYGDATQYTGLFLYIKDATTLAKFVSSGTALEIKLGSDSSNYYSKTYEDGDLAVGWNWLNLGVLGDLTETGTVSGNIDTFIITITTNNSTDEFAAGDVIYDLLRRWESSDAQKTLSSVIVDENTYEITQTGVLTALQANGFLIDSHLTLNSDSPAKALDIARFDGESKSSTDIFTIVVKNRII